MTFNFTLLIGGMIGAVALALYVLGTLLDGDPDLTEWQMGLRVGDPRKIVITKDGRKEFQFSVSNLRTEIQCKHCDKFVPADRFCDQCGSNLSIGNNETVMIRGSAELP